MMAGYLAAGMAGQRATFELFVRKMPAGRAYLVFAGLEQAIGDLLRLAFAPEQIEAIRRWPAFRQRRSVGHGIARRPPVRGRRLGGARGDGRLSGRDAGPGRRLLCRRRSGSRRCCWRRSGIRPWWRRKRPGSSPRPAAGRSSSSAPGAGHGPQAGMLAARSAYIAGFAGTSHVEAARRLGIPAVGTMAHSWVQSFAPRPRRSRPSPASSPRTRPCWSTPTTRSKACACAASIEPPIQAVRIDSGDLGTLARQARAILDHHGRSPVKIVASGDLDEYRIAQLVASGAPIDAFGVGTELVTSRDAPALAMVYKLVELDGEGKFKLSPGKKTYPLAKQVFRRRDRDRPVLRRPCRPGRRDGRGRAAARAGPSIRPARDRDCRRWRASATTAASSSPRSPNGSCGLDAQPDYPITYSERLEARPSG